MGWSSTYKSPNETARDFLIRQRLTWNNLPEPARPSVVASASGSSCIAFAVRYPAEYFAHVYAENPERAAWWDSVYVRDHDGAIRAACLFLTSCKRDPNDAYYNFGWKDMGETAGPVATVAPSILEHLSPLQPAPDGEAGYTSRKGAADWRERCKEASARRKVERATKAAIVPGARVSLPAPLNFRGIMCQHFRATMVRIRKRGGGSKEALGFQDITTGMLCRLDGKHLIGATVSPCHGSAI
jgi:hypothetical protein